MMDRSMNLILMVVFAVLGAAVLVLAWLQPMSGIERALSTIMGVAGLGVSTSRAAALKKVDNGKREPVAVPVENRK